MEQNFVIRNCGLEQLDEIIDMERETIEILPQPDMLRRNSLEMWRCCLQPPHRCIGVWVGEKMVAFAVLYIPLEDSEEDLSPLLFHRVDTPSANYKICIVRPEWRGNHLQVLLGRCLEDEARRRGIRVLCSTASPKNEASIRSLLQLGYSYDQTLEKYGFERNLYYKML
jgi:GNAT superfamily N-acetyltransferase